MSETKPEPDFMMFTDEQILEYAKTNPQEAAQLTIQRKMHLIGGMLRENDEHHKDIKKRLQHLEQLTHSLTQAIASIDIRLNEIDNKFRRAGGNLPPLPVHEKKSLKECPECMSVYAGDFCTRCAKQQEEAYGKLRAD